MSTTQIPQPNRLRRTSSIAVAAALIGGTLSVAAAVVAPQVAGATTTGVAASWSSTPNASGFVTATPPAGTVSATVVFSGGGGGSGGTNDNAVNGGAGSQINGTFNLTHNTGTVAVQLGNGGGAGVNCGSDFSACTAAGSSGGAGYEVRRRRWPSFVRVRVRPRCGQWWSRWWGVRPLPRFERFGHPGRHRRWWWRQRRPARV